VTDSNLAQSLHATATHIAAQTDLFDVAVPFSPGPGTNDAALAQVEQQVGVTLPTELRAATLELAGTRWHWSLKQELEQEWDADVCGASGGAHWLAPEEMLEARARLASAESRLGVPLLPFAKDAGGATSWLAVAVLDGRTLVVQASRDGAVERWGLEAFLDGWAAGGFRIADRWEDQPDSVVEHLSEELG